MKGLRSGFTLVELLVVIAIMSILTIITVGQFETARKKARDVQRKADLNSLGKALQMYYADYGVFPSARDGKLSVDGINAIDWGGEFKDASSYVYMKVLPKENTLALTPFCYAVGLVGTDIKKFALYAQLENPNDVECKSVKLSCNTKSYCYYVYSQNTILKSDGTFE